MNKEYIIIIPYSLFIIFNFLIIMTIKLSKQKNKQKEKKLCIYKEKI